MKKNFNLSLIALLLIFASIAPLQSKNQAKTQQQKIQNDKLDQNVVLDDLKDINLTIPHARDRYKNIWINLETHYSKDELQQRKFSKDLSVLFNYLKDKKKLVGAYVQIPHEIEFQSELISILKQHDFKAYRIDNNESVWIFRNERGIPDQSNSIADSRSIILNHKDEVLLIRMRGTDYWFLPGGGVDRGELTREAAKREVLEETGITIDAKDLKLVAMVNLFWPISGQSTNELLHVYIHTKKENYKVKIQEDEVDDYCWVSIESINAELKPKGIKLHPNILQLKNQLTSETSKNETIYDSSVTALEKRKIIETFKW